MYFTSDLLIRVQPAPLFLREQCAVFVLVSRRWSQQHARLDRQQRQSLKLQELPVVYLQLHNNRPFFNRKSSLFRANSTLSLHCQQETQNKCGILFQFATFPLLVVARLAADHHPRRQRLLVLVPAIRERSINRRHAYTKQTALFSYRAEIPCGPSCTFSAALY